MSANDDDEYEVTDMAGKPVEAKKKEEEEDDDAIPQPKKLGVTEEEKF